MLFELHDEDAPPPKMSDAERLAATKARIREQRKTGKFNKTKFDRNTERVAPALVGKQADDNAGGPVRERSTAARANAPPPTTTPSTPPPTGDAPSALPTPNVANAKPAEKPKRKRATVMGLFRDERKVKGGRSRSYAAFHRKLELQRRIDAKSAAVRAKREARLAAKRQRQVQKTLDKNRRKEEFLKRVREAKERRRILLQRRYERKVERTCMGQDGLVSQRVNPTTVKVTQHNDLLRFRSITIKFPGHWQFKKAMPLMIKQTPFMREKAKRDIATEQRKRYVKDKMHERLLLAVNPPKKPYVTRYGRKAQIAGEGRAIHGGRSVFNERCDP